VGESGFAHAADGHDTAGYADFDFWFQLFGGLAGILGQDLRDGVGEIEAVTIGLETESFNLIDAR
jgi:hypothetical protein